MNPYALLPLTGFVVNAVLASAVLARSPRGRANRLYAAIALALTYWSILKFALRLSGDAESAIRLYQLSAFGWCMIPSLYLHFACVFTRVDGHRLVRAGIWAAHVAGAAFAIIALVPGAMVERMVLVPWGYAHVPGLAYRVFSVYLGMTFLFVLVTLVRGRWRARTKEERSQVGFLLVGMAIPLVGGVVTNMLLPLLGYRVVELGVVSSTANAALIAWAMARHGLLAVSLEQVAETLLATVGDALLVADRSGRIVLANDAAAQLLGVPMDELVGQPVAELLSAPSIRLGAQGLGRAVKSEEATLQPADGDTIPVLLSANAVRGPDDQLQGTVYVARDIRELRGMMEQLQELAITDELTGVRNRRFAAKSVAEELERSIRYGRALSVGIVDLDDFKQINDRHGHAAGDEVLSMVAEALCEGLRASDLVARWGGDEFLLVMPETDTEAACSVCERILASIASRAPPGLEAPPRVSIGLATVDHSAPPRDADELIRAADEALYEAKRRGKGRVVHAAA